MLKKRVQQLEEKHDNALNLAKVNIYAFQINVLSKRYLHQFVILDHWRDELQHATIIWKARKSFGSNRTKPEMSSERKC